MALHQFEYQVKGQLGSIVMVDEVEIVTADDGTPSLSIPTNDDHMFVVTPDVQQSFTLLDVTHGTSSVILRSGSLDLVMIAIKATLRVIC